MTRNYKDNEFDVIIVGGGDIGFYLCDMLLSAGISVKMIEKRFDRCEFLSEQFPKASIIHGDGSNQQLLLEEDIESAEGLVALTDFDEENVFLSLYGKKAGVRKIVTKINRIAFEEVLETLDLDTVIHPRSLTAEYILQYVRARRNSYDSNVETLHWIVDNKAEALEFHIGESFRMKGVPLAQIRLKDNILVAGINRNGKIILPRGQDVMQAGDTVIIVTTRRGLNDIHDILR